jgi:hypothetical protein
MMPRMRKALPLIVLVLTALPTPAWAAVPLDVYVGPVRVRAYEMSIVATPRDRDSAPAVFIEFDRNAGRPFPKALGGRRFAQSHSFLVDHGARVDIARDLRSATVRADFGRYGRIDLTVSAPASSRPLRCLPESGEGKARGQFRLRPGGRYFGTIARRTLPALISGDVSCAADARAQPPATTRRPGLFARKVSPSRFGRILVASEADGEAFVSMIRPGKRVFVTDMIEEHAPPPSTLIVQPDLSAATFNAFGPFLSGVGRYTASSTPTKGRTSGTLSGNLTAEFDTPGPVAISGIPAALGRIG